MRMLTSDSIEPRWPTTPSFTCFDKRKFIPLYLPTLVGFIGTLVDKSVFARCTVQILQHGHEEFYDTSVKDNIINIIKDNTFIKDSELVDILAIKQELPLISPKYLGFDDTCDFVQNGFRVYEQTMSCFAAQTLKLYA